MDNPESLATLDTQEKNGQSRVPGNVRHTRHGTKTKSTAQHRKIKIWATQIPPKTTAVSVILNK